MNLLLFKNQKLTIFIFYLPETKRKPVNTDKPNIFRTHFDNRMGEQSIDINSMMDNL